MIHDQKLIKRKSPRRNSVNSNIKTEVARLFSGAINPNNKSKTLESAKTQGNGVNNSPNIGGAFLEIIHYNP